MRWDNTSGRYLAPKQTWQKDLLVDEEESDLPDVWLSRPGGEYHIAASFHFPYFKFPTGTGKIGNNIIYRTSPFLLHHTQDPYNSWNVTASTRHALDCTDHWDWLPGILLINESQKFTLPADELSAYAGTELADNDPREFHGFLDGEVYEDYVREFIDAANQITGPGWANWPFGHRQLEHAVMCWVQPGIAMPEVLLLLSVRQAGAKFSYYKKSLYNPGEKLGAWLQKPPTWDCRQAMRFIYQASLLAHDGMSELSLVSAIASLENATVEILSFLTNGNATLLQKEFSRCKFLNRFDKILPKYGVILPINLFDSLKTVYFARNNVAHLLTPINQSDALIYVRTIEDILAWYLAHV